MNVDKYVHEPIFLYRKMYDTINFYPLYGHYLQWHRYRSNRKSAKHYRCLPGLNQIALKRPKHRALCLMCKAGYWYVL